MAGPANAISAAARAPSLRRTHLALDGGDVRREILPRGRRPGRHDHRGVRIPLIEVQPTSATRRRTVTACAAPSMLPRYARRGPARAPASAPTTARRPRMPLRRPAPPTSCVRWPPSAARMLRRLERWGPAGVTAAAPGSPLISGFSRDPACAYDLPEVASTLSAYIRPRMTCGLRPSSVQLPGTPA